MTVGQIFGSITIRWNTREYLYYLKREGAVRMSNESIVEKVNSVNTSFELLLESIASVNQGVMGLSSEAFIKGDIEKAQEYNDKSSSLLRFTKNLLELKNTWKTYFDENPQNDEVIAVTFDNSDVPIPPIKASITKAGYVCNSDQISMEFESNGGRPYSLKLPKTVFRKVVTYVVEYLKVNEYIQSKDIVAALGEYLSTNTNYKDIKPIASKTLKFLIERKLLTFRNGMTGYYKLAGKADDVFDFLNNFDKKN